MTQSNEPQVEYVALLTFGGINPPPMEELGAYDDIEVAKDACERRVADLDVGAHFRNAIAWMPTADGAEGFALPNCSCSVRRRQKADPEMVEAARDE